MASVIRIVLIDDHPLWLQGVSTTLAENPEFEVVAEGKCAEDAVRLAGEFLPDIMMLDVSMPGGGVVAASEIAANYPAVKTVMLTVSEDEETVLAALMAGAKGYVLKGVSENDLKQVIKDINAGATYITPSLATMILMDSKKSRKTEKADPLDDLNRREQEILALLSTGLSNREIATKLHLSEPTIKHYMTNILQKLQLRNRVEAALWAQKQKLMQD